MLSTVGGDKTAMRSLRRAKLSVDFVRWTLEAIQAEQNAKSVVSHEMISRADSNNALRSSNALGPCAQSARVRYDSAGGSLMLLRSLLSTGVVLIMFRPRRLNRSTFRV